MKLRPDDPAVQRAAVALRKALTVEGRPVLRVQVMQQVRAALLDDGDGGRSYVTEAREHELAAAQSVAEAVVWELVSPGAEVHTEVFVDVLVTALTDGPVRMA